MNLTFQKLFFTTLLGLSSHVSFTQNWDKFSVYLGEKNWNDKVEQKSNGSAAITIRLDSDGNYYPNFYIEDKSMKKADGKLKLWYEKNSAEFDAILKSYNLPNNEESIKLLNKSIENNFIKLIDSASKNKEVIFLIHGYRKQMYKQKDNALSMKENDVVEKYLGNDKLFVEVYWDSRHISLIKGVIEKRILKMMEASASPIAKKVGTQLRTLVSSIQKSKIAIISHSLGSIVANELSFNYNPEEKLMDGKELNMVYLAPAIGYESFKTANQRGSGIYKLNSFVAYNNDDFVLNKDFSKFGIQIDSNAKTYGDTSLGCNHEDDIAKLTHLYKTELATEEMPLLLNMSGRINHNFSYYVRHPYFSEVMKALYGE